MLEVVVRHRQLLVFLVGGVLSVLIDVGVMQLLILNDANVMLATSVGFASGLVFNLTFSARYTFQSALTGQVVLRYLCVVLLNYLITIGCVAMAVALIDNALAGKMLALFIVPVNSFLLGKHWTFK